MQEHRETNILLQAQGINLTLGGHHILDNLDLEIKDLVQTGEVRGQVRGILGPSGIGKTLFLNLIAGLRKPDTGTVKIARDGENLEIVEPGMVGVVAQHYPLFEHLTVEDNLIIAGKGSGISSKEAKDKAHDMLTRFGLYERKGFWPSQLSGGQRQRVAILQQVIGNRLFLIMDEPFSGLDPRALHDVVDLIKELAGAHELNTILVISHDIRAVMRIAEKIHILGREFDDQGNMVRGAHFVEHINLLEKHIAWENNIRELPQFNHLVNEIEDKFEKI